jgi:hypothetical protein
MPQVYVDLDGTLVDLEAGYEARFGVRPTTGADDIDWAKVRSVPGFYRDLPMMADWRTLWDFVSALPRAPIILTGCPKSVPEAAADKRAMVFDRLGDVEVICCASRDKSKVLQDSPGGILIDDWTRYQDRWIAAGGKWITHTSAENSVDQLLELGIGL